MIIKTLFTIIIAFATHSLQAATDAPIEVASGIGHPARLQVIATMTTAILSDVVRDTDQKHLASRKEEVTNILTQLVLKELDDASLEAVTDVIPLLAGERDVDRRLWILNSFVNCPHGTFNAYVESGHSILLNDFRVSFDSVYTALTVNKTDDQFKETLPTLLPQHLADAVQKLREARREAITVTATSMATNILKDIETEAKSSRTQEVIAYLKQSLASLDRPHLETATHVASVLSGGYVTFCYTHNLQNMLQIFHSLINCPHGTFTRYFNFRDDKLLEDFCKSFDAVYASFDKVCQMLSADNSKQQILALLPEALANAAQKLRDDRDAEEAHRERAEAGHQKRAQERDDALESIGAFGVAYIEGYEGSEHGGSEGDDD